MATRVLPTAAAALLVFAAGWGTARVATLITADRADPEVGGTGAEPERADPPAEARAEFRERLDEILRDEDGDRATGAFLSLVAGAHPRELKAVSDRLHRETRGPRREVLQHLLLERWIQTDPAGAAAAAVGGRARQVFARWAAIDPVAAIEGCLAYERPRDAFYYVIQEIARRDPRYAIEVLNRLERDDPRAKSPAGLRRAVFKSWAETDPAAAAQAVEAIESRGERLDLSAVVAAAWAMTDGPAAAKFLERYPTGGWQRRGMGQLIRSWSRSDPDGAAAYLRRRAAGPAYEQVIREAANALYEKRGLDAALDWLDRLGDGFSRQEALSRLGREAVKQDPSAASKVLDRLFDPLARNNFISSAAREMAGRDPGAAIRWAESLDREARGVGLASVLRAIATADPEAAARSLDRTAFHQRHYSAMAVAESWVQESPAAALRWAEGQEDERMREFALRGAVRGWAALDSGAALAYLESLPPGELRVAAARSYVYAVTDADPAEAASVASRLLDRQALGQIAGSVGPRLVRLDPAAAAGFIDTLPPGNGRDSAVRALVDHTLANDPAGAFAWAVTIDADGPRVDSTRAALGAWAARDKDGALQALARSPLPEEEREELRSAVEGRGPPRQR